MPYDKIFVTIRTAGKTLRAQFHGDGTLEAGDAEAVAAQHVDYGVIVAREGGRTHRVAFNSVNGYIDGKRGLVEECMELIAKASAPAAEPPSAPEKPSAAAAPKKRVPPVD